jgi:hypothetical protein
VSAVLCLQNERIQFEIGEDGRTARLIDLRRKAEWRLDPDSLRYAPVGADGKAGVYAPLPPGRVERTGDALCATYSAAGGAVRVRWELAADHVRVRLEVESNAVQCVELPGLFRPVEGGARLVLSPYQGVLYLGGAEPWEDARGGGAHGNLSLSMSALLGRRGALMLTAEDLADWQARFGEDAAGPFLTFRAERCAADGWYPREFRIYPLDAAVTAIARRYRARLKERGEFVGWQEKIARKPALEQFFGSLIAFLGYNKSPSTDYVASARRVREMGFDRVLYYPVRICNYSLGFLMGGDEPIWLLDGEIAQFRAVPGALVAPWGWTVEALDDGSERIARLYRRDPAGRPYDGWRIEQQQWRLVCTPYQVEEISRRYAGDLREMDWIHFDVNATRLGRPVCHAPAHALHGGRPLGKRGDVEWTRRLLGPDTNGNRIVSSEGFVDRYAVSVDIGSTKVEPAPWPSRFIPVPLTGLTLHDSCAHVWWEIYNYNALPGAGLAVNRYGLLGSGHAQRKAALDALYGCPPHVFPFGRQYGWTDIGNRRTFSYQIHLDDREVQRALACALPVAQLHRRIGPLDMVDFEFLSEDYALQRTTFSDGTRVTANFGDRPHRLPDGGPISPERWAATGG